MENLKKTLDPRFYQPCYYLNVLCIPTYLLFYYQLKVAWILKSNIAVNIKFSKLRIIFGPLGIFLMTEFSEGAQLATSRNHSNFHWKTIAQHCYSPSIHYGCNFQVVTKYYWASFLWIKRKMIQCLKIKSLFVRKWQKILFGQIM